MRKNSNGKRQLNKTLLALTLASGFAFPLQAQAAEQIDKEIDKRNNPVTGDNSVELFGLDDAAIPSYPPNSDFDIKVNVWAGTAISDAGVAAADVKAGGLLNENAGTITTEANNINITAAGGTATSSGSSADAFAAAYGLYNYGMSGIGGNITTQGANNISITATGGFADSDASEAFAYAEASGLSNQYVGTITTEGNNNIAITATGGSADSKAGGIYANAYAAAYGLSNLSTGTIAAKDNDINITATGGSATAPALSVANAYAEAIGLNNKAGGTIETDTNNIIITAIGGRVDADAGQTNAEAFGLSNEGAGEITTKTNNIVATATGGNAYVAGAVSFAATANAYGLRNYGTGTITTTGVNNIIAAATGGNATSSAVYAATAATYGLRNYSTGTIITDANNISVTATGGRTTAPGSFAATAGAFGIVSDDGSITAYGEQNVYTQATAGTAGGVADVAFAYALLANNGSVTLDNQGAAVRLTGDIVTIGTGGISFSLDNPNSFWRPRFQDAYTNPVGDDILNGALGSGSFTIKNGAVIDTAWASNHGGASLAMRQITLDGTAINIGDGATFIINSDLAQNDADTISATSPGLTVSGTQYVKVAYDPSMMSGEGGTVKGRALVLDFAGANGKGQDYIYEDKLFRLDIFNVVMEGGYLTSVDYVKSPTQQSFAAADMQLAQVGVLRAQASSLNRRMGELRADSEGDRHGVWARTWGGKQNADSSYDRSFTQDYYAMQLGYDWMEQKENGKYITGITLEHMQADASYERGSGKTKSTLVGGYLSWLGNKGHYVDVVAKMGKMRNRYGITDLNNQSVNADYNNWAYTFSMEYGYRHKLSEKTYLEPQAELLLGKMQGVDYTASNGVLIRQKNANIALARLGVLYGLNFGKDNKNNAYIKGSLLHDFSGNGDLDSSYGGASRVIRGANNTGTAFELSLGTNIKTSEKDHLYFELTKTFGGDLETEWQLNAGWRMSF